MIAQALFATHDGVVTGVPVLLMVEHGGALSMWDLVTLRCLVRIEVDGAIAGGG